MSVVGYYARVSDAELEALRRDPERFWSLKEMPWDLTQAVEPTGSECLYVDKDWQVLSWLCSETGRAEERHQAAMIKFDVLSIRGVEAFKSALAEAMDSMGFQYVDDLPADPVLTALQGRREGDAGETLPNVGLGSAAVFDPHEVKALAAALNGLDEGWLRSRFDVAEMEALDLGGDYQESEFDEFYLPQLKRLQALYGRAAEARQHVVLVMS